MLVPGAELSDPLDEVREAELVEERLDIGGDLIEGGINALTPGTTRPNGRIRGGERILDAAVTLTDEVRLNVDSASPERDEPADMDPERCRGTTSCSGRTRGVAPAAGLLGGVVAVSFALIRTPVGLSLDVEMILSLGAVSASLIRGRSGVSSVPATIVTLEVRGRVGAGRSMMGVT